MTLTIIFLSAALLIVFKHYHLVRVNYDKFPDKIPTHIGPSGKADSWGKKNFLMHIYYFLSILVVGAHFFQ